MGFSRPEYWTGLLCPPLGDLPNPGIEPRSPSLQENSLPAEPPGKPKEQERQGSKDSEVEPVAGRAGGPEESAETGSWEARVKRR